MVKFIFGGSGSGKSEYVFSEIEKLLAESDKKICLIVPEQFTVTAEREITERFPPSAALRLEATNFTRLADSVARRVGGLNYSRLTKGAKMLILWRALMSVWPSLSELNKTGSGDGVGLIPTLFTAERELRVGGITPDVLTTAAEKLSEDGDSALSRRAFDLALVCAAAESMAEGEFGEVGDPIRRLGEVAAESGYFRGTAVFIDSFYSLTGAQTKVIAELVRCADDVTFTIPMESRDAIGIHLDGVKRYYESALAAALRYCDEKPEFVTLRGNHRAESRELALVQDRLWDLLYTDNGEDYASLPSAPESVSVLEVADRYDEAEALCARIASLVRDGGRYSDIAVACSSAESIRGICDSALRRHGIPAFFSETARVSSSPAVRLILSLLAVPGKWRREDVISIIKTGISPLSDSLACTFETYTDIWNVRGKRAFTSSWSMNPDGYREEISPRGAKALLEANEARDILIPHIEKFCSVFDGGMASVTDVITAIVEFFAESGAYEKMMARADSLETAGSPDDAARERLVWREICTAFDTMAEIIGSIPVDPTGFASLFRYVISDADTGAIPTGVDVVTVAGASSLRTDGVRHMIILGALEGEFPTPVEEKGYFSDDDREKLSAAGAVFGADLGELMSESLFRFGRAVSQASETLTVFTPKVSGGTPAVPSEGAMRILSLLGRERPSPAWEVLRDRVYDKVSLDNVLKKHASEKLSSLRRELFGEVEEVRFTPAEESSIDRLTAAELFGEHLRLSQSRINTYVKCPMSYYCRYVLRLSEDRKAEIGAPDIGTFVHAILEQLLFRIKDADTYPEGEELDSLCSELIESYVRRTCGDVTDGRMAYLFLRLKRQVTVFAEAIIREASQSRFAPYRVELPVGINAENSDHPSPPALIFPLEGGGEVSLHGFIDRLDVYRHDGKTYIRVIDYKTGYTKFSYDDVKIGLNVQLLLYLFSAWKSDGSAFRRELDGGDEGEVLPAGALYFNLRPGDPTSDTPLTAEEAKEKLISTMERSGIVTDDRDVLDAMDRGISGKYVPVSLKADGSLKKSASLATLERFGQLYRELEDVICNIATEMKSGSAPARPLESHGRLPCDYCEMKSVCRRENK